VIHSKFNDILSLRELRFDDKKLTFEWANDPHTRTNSFDTNPIPFENHSNWFDSKLKDNNSWYYIGEINGESVGLVRFDKKENKIVIGISIDKKFRGKKLASILLEKGCEIVSQKTELPIVAYIKKDNIPSIKSFERAGFIYQLDIIINDIVSYEYIYKK
jgi:RimJ/RimL family protein N-acetyltransferase